jgi:hypothetical protein
MMLVSMLVLLVLLLVIRRVERTAKSGDATAKETIVSEAQWLAAGASSQVNRLGRSAVKRRGGQTK